MSTSHVLASGCTLSGRRRRGRSRRRGPQAVGPLQVLEGRPAPQGAGEVVGGLVVHRERDDQLGPRAVERERAGGHVAVVVRAPTPEPKTGGGGGKRVYARPPASTSRATGMGRSSRRPWWAGGTAVGAARGAPGWPCWTCRRRAGRARHSLGQSGRGIACEKEKKKKKGNIFFMGYRLEFRPADYHDFECSCSSVGFRLETRETRDDREKRELDRTSHLISEK